MPLYTSYNAYHLHPFTGFHFQEQPLKTVKQDLDTSDHYSSFFILFF